MVKKVSKTKQYVVKVFNNNRRKNKYKIVSSNKFQSNVMGMHENIKKRLLFFSYMYGGGGGGGGGQLLRFW